MNFKGRRSGSFERHNMLAPPLPVIAWFQHLAVLAIWVFVVALIFNKWNKITTDPDILVSGESGCGSQAIYNVFCEIMARVGGFVIVLAFGSVTFQNQCFFFPSQGLSFLLRTILYDFRVKFFLTFLTPSKKATFHETLQLAVRFPTKT